MFSVLTLFCDVIVCFCSQSVIVYCFNLFLDVTVVVAHKVKWFCVLTFFIIVIFIIFCYWLLLLTGCEALVF